MLAIAATQNRLTPGKRGWFFELVTYLVNLAITDTGRAGEPAAVQEGRGDEVRADGARRRERRTGYASRSGEVGAGRGKKQAVSGQFNFLNCVYGILSSA